MTGCVVAAIGCCAVFRCGLAAWFWVSGLWKGWKTWRRPTLPCLGTQYHGRWGFSRPSSGWDRVRAPREDHQVVQPFRSRQFSVVSIQTESQTGWGRAVLVLLRADDLRMISMHGVPAFLSSLVF